MTPVLLCGGHGTRLWPLSRKSYPKQFLPLIDAESPFQSCAKRLTGPLFEAPLIITSHDFRFIAAEQCTEVGLQPQSILIEPHNRNTAPAVLAAAMWLAEQDPDAMMLVSPCDHLIPDTDAFQAAVEAALPAAESGQIVTFGVVPTRPDPGYGYLELETTASSSETATKNVARFVEKPDIATAETMLKQGGFLWNAGIFLFSVRTILAAFGRYTPELTQQVTQAVKDKAQDLDFCRLAAEPWGAIDPISVDYAVMERAENLVVMPYDGHWSDLGSWGAVWKEGDADAAGNVCSAHATAIDCTNTLLRSDHETLELVGLGLSDIIAVALPDAVLVAHRSEDQRVGQVVKTLQARAVPQA
ncbi:MAG: mannose-1-phosphate guanylyltransferase/mannose-6-phosphate isomerase, partial [Paracoccaceae bacterium]